MELSILLAQQIAAMALMILVGYAAAKAKILDYAASGVLSTLILYILAPCMIISSYQIEFTQERFVGLMLGFAAAVIVHLIFIPLALLLKRFYPMTNIERASLIYSNAGNLIIPLVGAVLGSEYVFYTSAYVTLQTILLWTHGVCLVSEKATMDFKKIIANPCVIGTIGGVVLYLLPVQLPDICANAINKMGSTIGPMSMLSIGIIMSTFPLKQVLSSGRAYLMCFLRLIFFPLVLIIFIRLTGVTHLIPNAYMVLMVTVLAACAPTAVSVTQFARLFDEDAGSGSVINVLSTILCVATMPVMLYIYQVICS